MKKNSKSKIKSNSPLPLYFQIKEDLKSKIENGILNGLKHKTGHTRFTTANRTFNLKNVAPWIH